MRALYVVAVLWLTGVHGACEPWCAEPCVFLNGNLTREFGTCNEGTACWPGAESFDNWHERVLNKDLLERLLRERGHDNDAPTQVSVSSSGRQSVSPSGGLSGSSPPADGGQMMAVAFGTVSDWGELDAIPEGQCVDVKDSNECRQWKDAGACDNQRQYMTRFCAHTCLLCEAFAATPCAHSKCHRRLSLFDERFPENRDSNARCSSVARLFRASDRCKSLEDEGRVADRGYYVLRGAVDREELTKMRELVAALPHKATRLLCGASDVQPEECKLDSGELAKRFPRVVGTIKELFDRWIASGFNEAAGLGWPLMISGAEFISINKWEFAKNASCVLSDVYAAAESYVDPLCSSSCPEAERNRSTSPCWAKCRYDAIVNRMPKEETAKVLETAKVRVPNR